MSHNPNITHNSNNNYSVDIVTEPDLSSPSVIEYSATTNTPFVTVKITPNDPQVAPVLASNIKIDDIIPAFAWNEGVNYNVKGICEPPVPPHNANSSLQHVTGIGVTSYCSGLGFNSFFGNSNVRQQGPYEAQNDSVTQTSQIAANGVSWSEIILIEVYEDDLGELINDSHSPAVAENYNEWLTWDGPVQTPGGPRREITTNIYPVYVKAFVYLSFGSGGMSGVTSNINLNLDIDEVEPTYGCTDPLANNYDATATVDDGSCIIPPPPPPPPTYSLPPFSFTYAGPLYNLQGNTSPSQPIVTNISWQGQTWALMSFTLNVLPAINPLPNSSGVAYHITELYYLDNSGTQVNLNYMPGAGAQSPSYNLIGSGFSYIFQNYNSSNTLSPLVQLFTPPVDITAAVLLGGPYNIDGAIFLNPPTPITGSGWPIDITCTVTATDTGAITTTHTEVLSITV